MYLPTYISKHNLFMWQLFDDKMDGWKYLETQNLRLSIVVKT